MSHKYKVGDKVRLKILDDYDVDRVRRINGLLNRVVTIEKVMIASEVANTGTEKKSGYYYNFEELFWAWREDSIECTEEEYLHRKEEYLTRPTVNRFQLMDFSDEL
jgi:hypothetical protein